MYKRQEYDALETCAVDGTCMLSCPVGIDTGRLVKELRARQRRPREERAALALARRWEGVERAARMALRAPLPMRAATGVLRAALSHELVPAWSEALPPPAAPLPATARAGAAAVYLPACVNRIFGRPRAATDELGLPEALVRVSARAGLPVWIPPDVAGHCCGTPWSSKGYRDGHAHMAERTSAALSRWSDEGRLPVVVDASSCALGLVDGASGVEVLDSIAWAHDRLLARLEVHRRLGSAAVHPPCGARHLGLAGKLERLAALLADEVLVPAGATCCGFGGDRGLLHPELVRAATAAAGAELREHPCEAHLSSNRTCEIGLEQATGAVFESFLFSLEQATRPAPTKP